MPPEKRKAARRQEPREVDKHSKSFTGQGKRSLSKGKWCSRDSRQSQLGSVILRTDFVRRRPSRNGSLSQWTKGNDRPTTSFTDMAKRVIGSTNGEITSRKRPHESALVSISLAPRQSSASRSKYPGFADPSVTHYSRAASLSRPHGESITTRASLCNFRASICIKNLSPKRINGTSWSRPRPVQRASVNERTWRLCRAKGLQESFQPPPAEVHCNDSAH